MAPLTAVATIDDAVAAMLPALRRLADALAGEAVGRSAAAGAPVSCRAGCGACCRQLVPLLPAEAVAFERLLAELPEERRAVVVARAIDARRLADEAGLGPQLDASGGPTTLTSRRRLAAAWFALEVPCPFLEDESCSIHPDRPIACREYLVSSDPAFCAAPTEGNVVRVELLGSAMEASKQAARAGGADDPRRVTTLVDAVISAATAQRRAEAASLPVSDR
jgi:Fe-S-cluster containining protein